MMYGNIIYLKTKGFLFDATAPYDCFDERMSAK